MSKDIHGKPWKRTTPLFLGHLVNDGYGCFFAPLLPLLIDRLDLSLTMAGLLGTIRIVMNSLTQPALGHLIDRTKPQLWVVVGPILTICAMGFIGSVGSFYQLLWVLIVAGIGTALFHPAAASLVAASGRKKRELVMAFFSSGGTVGGAIAPLVIVAYVSAFGMARTPWLILPAFVALAWISVTLVRRRFSYAMQTEGHRSTRQLVLPPMLVLLWFVIVTKSLAETAFSNFLAVMITARGASTFAGGAGISVFLLAGAVGGFLGGSLASRLGAKWVLFMSATLAAPFYLLFLYGPTSLSLVFLAAAGLFTFSSIPVGVVAAQELLPGKTGLVSGLVMGFAWGIGGLALTPIGWLADRYGLVSVMTGVACLPLAAGALILFYHEERVPYDTDS